MTIESLLITIVKNFIFLKFLIGSINYLSDIFNT